LFGLAPAEALTLEFFHPGANGSEIVGSAHRDFLPSVYGANARYRVWFRRLGRDLALQSCRSRLSQPEIYHSLHGRVWARLRVCQRRWELWSPLLSVFAGRGRRRDALHTQRRPSFILFASPPDQPPWCEIGSSARPMPSCRLGGKSAPLPSRRPIKSIETRPLRFL
jgi:hypothetical protein